MHANEAYEYCKQRQAFWWERLKKQWEPLFPHADWSEPGIRMLMNGSYRKYGHYEVKTRRCAYNIAIAMLQGDTFDDTVVHEVAHAVQVIIYKHTGHRGPRHGELWCTIMRAAGQKARAKVNHGLKKDVIKKVALLARMTLDKEVPR